MVRDIRSIKGALLNALRSELAWKQLQERKEWTERKKVRRRLINESFHKAFPSYKEWLKARGKKREAEFWRYRESLPGILLGESENFEKPLHAQQQYRTEIIEWGRNEKGYKRRGYVYRESKTDAMSFVDTGRRIEPGAGHGAKSRRAGSDNRYRIARPDLSNIRRPVSGGQNVPIEKGLLIRHSIRDHRQAVVCIGNTDILRLSSVNPAAQRPAALRILTVVHKSPLTEEALSAEGFHIN